MTDFKEQIEILAGLPRMASEPLAHIYALGNVKVEDLEHRRFERLQSEGFEYPDYASMSMPYDLKYLQQGQIIEISSKWARLQAGWEEAVGAFLTIAVTNHQLNSVISPETRQLIWVKSGLHHAYLRS